MPNGCRVGSTPTPAANHKSTHMNTKKKKNRTRFITCDLNTLEGIQKAERLQRYGWKIDTQKMGFDVIRMVKKTS